MSAPCSRVDSSAQGQRELFSLILQCASGRRRFDYLLKEIDERRLVRLVGARRAASPTDK